MGSAGGRTDTFCLVGDFYILSWGAGGRERGGEEQWVGRTASEIYSV